ncbi:YadA C-terminal domain-containing protein, partial [Megasphaera elsdenii]|uniref:YadA C-terminal domain-containing protein n=1 Tax=Megasphaera elsdenii TaxID=907 RepID=UPI00265E9D63
QNVANTTIEEGSKNAVNAGTVYKETRVEKDGTFIRQANTAGENITALDHQVAANAESIYHINNRVSNLDNRINKVGAGAAALAALHPLDFDPDDKWDFAVGYGNYRNANSVAFGAFYRPNEDTMFSLGTNFGNGENMFNAGVSFKIGQGGSGITTSKTAMAKTISSLKDTVHKQDQKIEGLENVVDTQDKKIAELEALVKEQGEMIRQYVGKK